MIVNVYLNAEDKIKLNALSRKYEVSISTLAENILFYFTKYALKYDKQLCMSIGTEYKYKNNKGKKTSIKPKDNPTNNELYDNYTKAYTNALIIYLHKDLKIYMEAKDIERYYSELNTKLQKVIEPNYDYNKFIRSIKRYETKMGNRTT